MTIGQLVEGLVGKCAALQGMDADGTVFEEHDFESAKDTLEKLGYDRNGYEYMYNGMTGEKMLTKIFLCPTFYQRLKHLVDDKIHCLTKDHEVNTSNGWKPINEITKDDLVMCLNNGTVTYENPINTYAYLDYSGEMYSIVDDNVELTVTGNHRMWAKLDGQSEFDFHLARDINGLDLTYLTTNENGTHNEIKVTYNRIEKLYNDTTSVFCLQVPSEVFMVRRNGKAVWTANSRARGAVTALTRQSICSSLSHIKDMASHCVVATYSNCGKLLKV